MGRVAFLLRVVGQGIVRQDTNCPYCGHSQTRVIGKKRIVLQLRRCARCGLMYRWPKDTPRFNRSFYQRHYHQGMTTDMPDGEALGNFKASIFSGTEKDLANKIAVLKTLMPQGRVLDYGCSWGYGTFQLVAAGYEAVGFEVSKPRAEFGRSRLGVTVISSEGALDELAGSFDAVFASHVLEHLPAPSDVFDRLASLLKPNGLLLAFVPNCGGDEARRFGVNWGPICCEKHPLALDAEFLERALPKHGFKCAFFSSPYALDIIARNLSLNHRGATPRCLRGDELRGDELMVAARRIESAAQCKGSYPRGELLA